MIIRILLFLLLIPKVCFAGNVVTYFGTAGAAETYDYVERFDGSTLCATSYTSTCSYTWTVTAGTPDFDNATAPAPIEGTYSLSLPATAAVRLDHTADADPYYSVKFEANEDTEAAENIITIRNSSDAVLCTFTWHNTGLFRITAAGGTAASDSSSYAGGSIVFFKLHYVPGSGTDALCSFATSTDGVTWGSTYSSSDGTATTNASRIKLANDADTETFVFDVIKIKLDGDITDAR